MRWWVVVAAIGCSTSVSVDPDAGPEPGLCPLVAGWRACETRCAQDCTGESVCSFELGLCLPSPPEIGTDVCTLLPDYETTNRYCFGNDRFCATTSGLSLSGARNGTCVPRALCDEPGEIAFDCYYSDGSPYVRGPPAFSGACDDLCGGLCGGCEEGTASRFDNWPDWRFCVGINETRGAGICAVSERRCDYRYPLGDQGFFDEPARACLLTPSEPEVGWVVLMDSCLQYRSLFEGIECRDHGWNIAP